MLEVEQQVPDTPGQSGKQPMHVPVLAALVELEGRILLARNAAWPGRRFALITGFMEAGETPRDGIMREVKEEMNKVAWPKWPEVRRYSMVVLITVVIFTAYVGGLDAVFGVFSGWLYKD